MVLRVMPEQVCGPLADLIVGRLPIWLEAQGYAASTRVQTLAVARGLSAWMLQEDVGLEDLRVVILDAFEDSYGCGVCGHVIVSQRMPAVRRFLMGQGLVADAVAPLKRRRPPDGAGVVESDPVVEAELDAWGSWQEQMRAITPACVRVRRAWVTPLLESLPIIGGRICWDACDVEVLNSFIVERSRGLSQASGTGIVDAIRSLMRWALATGRVDLDLRGGVLRHTATRATVPKALSLEEVEAILGACSLQTTVGMRDRAVITVLYRLGLRAGETARLSLDDIDWEAGRLQVVGKGRRLVLPVPIDVGTSVVDWLKVRPDSPGRTVFVRVRTPTGELSAAGISDIVKHRAQDAGLPPIRAHRLRHTAGTNVLRDGGTLLEAQELLGHQHSSSTRVYARTDLISLRALTVELGRLPG